MSTSSSIIAGRRLMTRTRPASWTASSMSWVTLKSSFFRLPRSARGHRTILNRVM